MADQKLIDLVQELLDRGKFFNTDNGSSFSAYSLTWDAEAWQNEAAACLSDIKKRKAEETLRKQYAQLYALAGIDPKYTYTPTVLSCLTFIDRLVRERCNLKGSNDFSPRVFATSDCELTISCNGVEFKQTVLHPKLIHAYYSEILFRACFRTAHPKQRKGKLGLIYRYEPKKFEKSLGFTPLSTLWKEMNT